MTVRTDTRAEASGKAISDPAIRGIWLAITALAGVIVGTAAGILGWAGGLNAPTAVLTGGGAFAGTILLVLTALRFTAGADA
ncbi:hypothetical protein [Micromonospora noduli]|uniref:hypothetical protein n=1 Tax=Micromonospora noduli TaxID=709876 RepID=UPI000DDA5648|nr:hypothetical protein [Micromonospora noduli]